MHLEIIWVSQGAKELSHGIPHDNFIWIQTNLSVGNYSYTQLGNREDFGSFKICTSLIYFLGLCIYFSYSFCTLGILQSV